jgi:hypothetical protein
MPNQQKTKNFIFVPGVNERPYTEGASNISNLRFDGDRHCWVNDRGFIDYFNPDNPGTISPVIRDVYSIHSWKAPDGITYLLFEEDDGAGSLTLKVVAGQETNTLQTNRAKPSASDPGTQYCPIGRFLFILNGQDEPIIYRGGTSVRTAFFHSRPQPPTPVPTPRSIYPVLGDPAAGEMQTNYALNDAVISVLPKTQGYGASATPFRLDPASGAAYGEEQDNLFEYAVSFVSDTGAEGPLSPYSPQVSFQMIGGVQRTASNDGAKFLNALTDIPTGPEGTAKRRLYRTGNQQDGLIGAGRTLRFLADIEDNITTTYLDCLPSSALGSQAPSLNDSDVFPTGIRLAEAYKNYLFFAGSRENGSTLYFSEAGKPEQTPALNRIELGGRKGGDITALHASNNVLYVFRESAIDLLITTNNSALPFKAEAYITTVGTMSPNTIEDVPGLGTVFLGSDKVFYAVNTTGTYQGTQSLTRLSSAQDSDISSTIRRISKSSLPKATATYNEKDQEYWCHAPLDGGPESIKGFVFHQKVGAWSFRDNIPAGCFTQIEEGWTAFGSNASRTGLPIIGGVDASDANKGIMVWCGAKGDGYADNGQNPRSRDDGLPSWEYETTWLSLGDPNITKRIDSVFLYIYRDTGGGGKCAFGADWKSLKHQTDASVSLETTFTTANVENSNAGVYGTAVYDDPFSLANISEADKNRFASKEIAVVRIDNPYGGNLLPQYQATEASAGEPLPPPFTDRTSPLDGQPRWVKFRLKGEGQAIQLIGFAIDYTLNGERTQLSHLAGTPDSPAGTAIRIMGL